VKIVAFVYDFPHFKSAQGLFALKRAGLHDVRCVAAPWRRLDMRESYYQFRTHDMADAHHPREAAAALGYRYEAGAHEYVRLSEGERGIVLGARVLPRGVVESGPIVNLHPGVLPLNRGLDTLKWAVRDGLPQAVSVHRIDARVDRGVALTERIVSVHSDDGPADVYNRVMWAQIELAPWAVMHADQPGAAIGAGVYRKPMTAREDMETAERFAAYKRLYATICEAYGQDRAAA